MIYLGILSTFKWDRSTCLGNTMYYRRPGARRRHFLGGGGGGCGSQFADGQTFLVGKFTDTTLMRPDNNTLFSPKNGETLKSLDPVGKPIPLGLPTANIFWTNPCSSTFDASLCPPPPHPPPALVGLYLYFSKTFQNGVNDKLHILPKCCVMHSVQVVQFASWAMRSVSHGLRLFFRVNENVFWYYVLVCIILKNVHW